MSVPKIFNPCRAQLEMLLDGGGGGGGKEGEEGTLGMNFNWSQKNA